MIDLPLITVVTISYNAVQAIESTICSVINQKYLNIEYIVIDGGSTDGTIEILKKYDNKISHWISEKDSGIYHAMNKGIALAHGKWLNFMNSGDCFVNDEVLNSVFLNREYICSDVLYGNTIGKYSFGYKNEMPESLVVMKRRLPFCHQSVFVKTKLLKETFFDVSYKIGADYNMFYSFFCNNKAFQYVDIFISVFEHETGISSAKNCVIWYKENARTRGEEKTILFKLKYVRVVLISKIKLLFKM